MNSTETRTLIDQAKAKLIEKPKATKSNKKVVDASDPTMVNELLAELSRIKDAIKILEAQESEIKDVFKDIIGQAEELHVYGAKVASISRWRETGLITDKVKETFPLVEYPELYKATTKSRLNIH
jgi:predicted phage-related endonuclease